ncbi:AIM24 family protein [Nostoc sp. CHAB 5715]|uniref:AIM24 family protein n=1 Tax=Nostoc sp. CHAB 5715 TaxID=2780400 RepID=UPI001E5836AA|nr:AIM24 family protein [Nostoc sp. CHAB 5715]MCC5621599.1 AIM24 family protein [Nostoc sp. CHAB 5715]
MPAHSLSQFVADHAEDSTNSGLFELESDRVLECNLNGMIWMKVGAMVAYTGQIKFTREGMLDQGIGNFLKKAISGEGASLSKAEGRGKLYLADGGKLITVLKLNNETVFVNGSDLLALESTLSKDITMMRKIAAMASGGLFNVKVGGTGMVAFGTHGEPLVLRVSPGNPVFTDPQATVAWSGGLSPEFKTDMSLKTFLGRGSGESFQMMFQGEGFVVVQPYEEDLAKGDS